MEGQSLPRRIAAWLALSILIALAVMVVTAVGSHIDSPRTTTVTCSGNSYSVTCDSR